MVVWIFFFFPAAPTAQNDPRMKNSYWKFVCSLICDFYTFWNDNICVHPRSISVDHHIRIQICINWISCKSVTLIWILISFDFLHRKSVPNFCSVKVNVFQNMWFAFEQKKWKDLKRLYVFNEIFRSFIILSNFIYR